jgi:hypothetical protein
VVIGAFGTSYALQTSRIAAETLKIETEPTLLAEVDITEEKQVFEFAVRAAGDRLIVGHT